MLILGISAFYHDSAACIVRDGEIVAAAQEERFSRKKHDSDFPARAVKYCLGEAGIEAEQLDYIGFYEKPLKKFERLLETYIAFAPIGFESFRTALPRWIGQKLHLPREIHRRLGLRSRRRLVFCEHHEAHAASAFFPSPFNEAAIITMDGVGEWATGSFGQGIGNQVRLSDEIRFPHSLGLLYSAFTYYTGFEVDSGEYKLMGLAPYGEPTYRDTILKHLIDVRKDGSFWMDMSYFNYCQGLTMTSKKFEQLFGGPPRREDEPITQRHMDLAASIQSVTEDVMLKVAQHVHNETGAKNLCLAGGVALNCVANGRILREGPFDNVWIQPAAGDAGGSLGVALMIWYQLLNNTRKPELHDSQRGSFLGPDYKSGEFQSFLNKQKVPYETLGDDELLNRVVELISEGKVVGWFQGRMEFGPRALGNRSIIGDPRNRNMQTIMNVKVKFRESFRPFAPSVLYTNAHEYFETRPEDENPYMLIVAPVRTERRLKIRKCDRALSGIELLKVPRSQIPAVTHVDYSARLQTVDSRRNGRYYRLIRKFNELSGCPVLVNTSFNLGWEPIVNTPEEAFQTFMSCEMDALVVNDVLVLKDNQPANREAIRITANGNLEDRGLSSIWCCPACGGQIEESQNGAQCQQCSRSFSRKNGIWQMFWSDAVPEGDVTDIVKKFYEEHPFPNYDNFDSLRSLVAKSRKGIYAKLLGEQIPCNARVLEVGCGTGQLSNFLGVGCRTVVGTDMCLNSLRLAESFRLTYGLNRVRFLQMNLFHPSLRDDQFDVVLCNGVLHHTSDPYRGFRRIERLLKPGGYIIVGLYNRYGRVVTDARRTIFKYTDGSLTWLDPILKSKDISEAKRDAWFADQYRHPHESKHTFGEILRWFDQTNIEFVNAIPQIGAANGLPVDQKLFAKSEPGTLFSRGMTQSRMVFTGAREGGFFIMIGRKGH